MLATQAEKEALNERVNVVQRINFNLNDIKVEDSKKRRRPGTSFLSSEYGFYDNNNPDSLDLFHQTNPKQRIA